jgi:hypothetical protein
MRLAQLFRRRPRPRRVERVQDPWEADLHVLAALRELGCDPGQAHSVRHFVYVPAPAVGDVCATLARDAWQTSVRELDGTSLVVALRCGPLSEPVVRETRARLETLAAQHGGRYDGWEVDTD